MSEPIGGYADDVLDVPDWDNEPEWEEAPSFAFRYCLSCGFCTLEQPMFGCLTPEVHAPDRTTKLTHISKIVETNALVGLLLDVRV